MSASKLIVKRRNEKATLPKRASADAAGYDLCADESCELAAGERRIVSTGLSVTVPEGTYGRIAPRSGLAVKFGINVLAGVVDRDYTGPLGVVLVNHSTGVFVVAQGDRIAQLIVEKIATPEVEEVEDLIDTVRGEGGFGSTGGHSLPLPPPTAAAAEAE